MADQIRYDLLTQQALRGVVRSVLADTVKRGGVLPGDHHFYIAFDTTAEGVRMPDRLRAQYPEQITIILQHQFWDLRVTDDLFEVGLSFGGVPEKLIVPLAAIKVFADPSVQFTLQFETLVEAEEEAEAEPAEHQGKEAPRAPKSHGGSVPAVSPSPAKQAKDKADEKAGAEVVRLDRFRKK